MSFRTRRVLMGAPFYALISFFVLNYVLSYYTMVNIFQLLFLVLLLFCIQTLPMLFEEKKSTPIGRFFSKVSGIWQWLLVMLLIYSVVLFILSFIINIPVLIVSIILLTIPVIGIYSFFKAHRIVVKEKVLEFENLESEFNIVHLSDVHFGSIRHKKIIRDLSDKLCELSDSCDLVIISGDLADGSCVVEEDDFIELNRVDIPIIFTSGNHDYYPGLDCVHRACKKAGIVVLENSGISYDDINVYGLSFSFDNIDMPSRDELKSFVVDEKINIINYHIPNGWEELSDIGFNIQLSGHTHGGQFYPVVFFGNLMYEGHNMGLFRDSAGHYLHVTTGVGCMDFPMRWGTDSELVVLKLRKKKD
ncbi:MAG: metallophosphatase [Methanosphaera sp. rholeuAM270]|nr:MAG: metallophosphatase [Methanosphaera sp. rholeuAM270]